MQYNRVITLIVILAVCILQTAQLGVSSPDIVIEGYVYVNGELTFPDEVSLNIQNQMISTVIDPDAGYYHASVATIEPGTIVTFLVKISGKSYTPPETLTIENGIDFYGVDLTINITEGTTSNQGNNGSSTPPSTLLVSNPGGPYVAVIRLSIQFNGIKSTDPTGLITQCEWSFGDNTTATGVTPTHTYQQDGNYTVTLRVTDNKGNSTQASTYALIATRNNALYVGTIGYLIDTQNDGTYHVFYSIATGNSTLVYHNNNIYLLDINADGTFDHQYNIVTGELNSYSTEQSTNTPLPSNIILLLAALAIIIVITIALLVSIKRKKQVPQQTILGEKVDYRYDQQKIDATKITDVPLKEIQQKLDTPKIADGQVKEFEHKVDVPKITTEQSEEIQQRVEVAKTDEVQAEETQQKINVPKITNEHYKEIQQKIDEVLKNPKQKKKNNQ